ncbi:MAG: NTP transferase domain-containing protein, partial [Henriciella sp.]|uniref:nucleotidyltransferase family protein n=1 Tax=Henriciella sp. TaxID=1968823 RepID=UPI003C78BDCA
LSDDPYTAFILMFHDTDWETPLLKQVLAGPAFYVGAVGSSKTQARRLDGLRQAGLAEPVLQRVRGPVGLIPSMRDASMLAVSTLAEIVEAYHAQKKNALAATAVILLAAGQSARFEDGDKLMAELHGKPLLAHAARSLATAHPAVRLAVTAPETPERAAELTRLGWQIVENPEAGSGQASSLKAGIAAARAISGVTSVMVLLADMPDVPNDHLTQLASAFAAGHTAVMSEADGILSPPAIFSETCFDALCALSGDRGAKSVFESLDKTTTVKLRPILARDVDTLADLMDTMEAKHG